MKATLLLCLFVFLFSIGYSQTTVFHENFEAPSAADSVSSQGTPVWTINTTYHYDGLQCIRNQVSTNLNDTLSLKTSGFSTTGLNQVFLSFSHICKIDYSDKGIIEVSGDGGLSWNQLTSAHYLGSSQFGSQLNSFNEVCYITDWDAANPNTIPTNSWWKNETFDISAFAGNKASVMIRFRLYNTSIAPNVGYGWLIDDIKVTATPSETYPPVITMITAPSGNVYGSSSIKVEAKITDGTGVDTVRLAYSITNGISDTLGMIRLTGDTFRAFIPFPGYGRTFCYKIIAKDASSAANIGTYPATGCANFMTAYSNGGTFQLGTATTTTSGTCITPYSSNWEGSRSQYLILASELAALNMPGGNISSLGFKVTAAGGYVMNNFSIKMASTTETALTGYVVPSSYTTVYSNPSLPIPTVGINTINFTTPFVWNGSSNIIIDICHDNDVDNTCASCYGGNSTVEYTATSFNSVFGTYADNAQSCGVSASSTAAANTSRPNMIFNVQSNSLLTKDIGVSQIVNPNGGILSGVNTDVKVKIKNFGVDTITTATINWKLDGVLKTPFSWTGFLKKDSVSSEITIGSINVPGGNHTLDIWTTDPNGVVDNNWANDMQTLSFFACATQFAGTYTIGGTNPNFATFADALTGLTQCGVSGPVVLNIATGTYQGRFTVNNIPGASAINTITFKSVNNDTAVVLTDSATSATDNYIVKLNGANYVTFESITFAPKGSTYGNAVVLTNGAKYNTFKGNLFLGSANGATNNLALFRSEDVNSKGTTIIGNRFYKGSMAILVKGTSSTARIDSINILKNKIEEFQQYGIRVEYANAPILDSNIITTVVGHSGARSSIYLYYIYDKYRITRNSILNAGTNYPVGIFFDNCISTDSTWGLVANNFITLKDGTTNSYGLRIYPANYLKVVYNSINVNGGLVNDTRGINAATGSNIQIINNNVVSNYFPTFYENSAVSYSDYNNFYSTNGKYAYYPGAYQYFTTQAALAAAMQKDSNSVSVDPYFVSNTNLHAVNNLLNATAKPFSGITTDIDGDVRNTTTPDIGADEFNASPFDLTAVAFSGPSTQCGLGTTEIVKLKIKNIGSSNVAGGFSASYQMVGSSNIVTENVSLTINSGDTATYTFTTPANLDVFSLAKDSTFKFTSWVSLSTDNIQANDTAKGSVVSGYKPIPPVVTDTTINYGTMASLNPQTPFNVVWYTSPTATQSIFTGKPYNTGILYDTTKYWVEAKASSQVNVTIGNGTSLSSSTGYPTVFENYWYQTWQQYLFTKAELNAMGITAGNISSIAMEISTMPDGSYFAPDYNIKIGTTSNNALSTFTSTGLTNVYGPTTATGSVGWNTFTFSTPFAWDGISNIIIDLRQTGAYGNGNARTYYTTTTNTSVLYGYSSSNNSGYWTSSPTVYTSTSRPNMKFNATSMGLCSSDRVQNNVNVINYPTADAGVLSVTNPVGTFNGGVKQAIKVKIKNYSPTTLTTANINYSINGVIQPAYSWTGSLGFKDSTIVTVDSIVFSPGVYALKVYTSNPNGNADATALNDTVSLTVKAAFNGVYTIGDTTVGTFDFPNLVAVKNILNVVGVNAPTTFNLDDGIYTGKVNFTNVPGTSATNTITIQSLNGDSSLVILQDSNTSAANYVLYLNGTSYTTVKNITVKSTGSTYGYALFVQGPTTNNTIQNCNIISVPGTSTTRGGIMAAGLNHNLAINNNLVTYGYYGIYAYGVSSSSLSKKNLISNNLVDSFSYYGIYGYYQDSIQIKKNVLNSSPAMTTGYGMYFYYCNNGLYVTNNKILMKPIATSGTVNGIYAYYCYETSAKRGIIANNFVSVYGQNNGNAHIGINSYYSDYLDIMFNSVNIQAGNASSIALRSYNYASTSNTTRVYNNNLRNTALGFAYYVYDIYSINMSNNNNLYTNGTNLAYWTSNKANLAALITSSYKDSSSVSLNVPYVDSIDLHITSPALSGRGIYDSRVVTDIDGLNRSIIPTIGAVEIPQAIDAGITKVVINPSSGIYGGNSIAVKMAVKNFGTDSIYNFPVSYSVNGAIPVTATYTGTLQPAQVDTILMPNFTSPDGNSTICGFTAHPNDTNTYNDQSCTSFYGIPNKDAVLQSILPLASGCGLTTDSVRIRIINNGGSNIDSNLTAYYYVNNSATISQVVTQSIIPGDTITFTFSTPINLAVTTNDSTFNVKSWVTFVGDNVNYNDSATKSTISLHTPLAPLSNSFTVPYGSIATINATSPSNDPLSWYDSLIGGTLLATGSSYTTPNHLYVNDTFYVSSSTGTAFNASIGTGNGTQTYPFYAYWGYTRSASIYQASEVGGYGLIDQIQWKITTSSNINLPIKIYLAQTTAVDMTTDTWSNLINNATLVYDGTQNFNTIGWLPVNLTNIFNYSSGNLMVLCEANYGGFGTSPYPYFEYSSAGAGTHQTYYADNNPPTGNGSLSQNRPNIKLSLKTPGCESSRVPIIVNILNVTNCDLGIDSLITPVSAVGLTNAEVVKVRIKNYTSGTQSNFNINYSINGGSIQTTLVTGSIAPFDTLSYSFTQTADLSLVGSSYKFKIWTSLSCDSIHFNDTIVRLIKNQLPPFCASNATSTADEDLGKVVFAGINHGSALPVTSNPAANQTYNNYMDSSNYIATVQPGMSYPMSLSIIFSSGGYTGLANAYIDFNGNGVWDLPAEKVFSKIYDGSANSTVTDMITIPFDAVPGFKTLRIVVDESDVAPACGTYSWGETEDYMVNILPQIPHDVNVDTISDPSNLVLANSPVNISTRIRNVGSDTIQIGQLSVNYFLNNNPGTPITNSVTMAPGDTLSFHYTNVVFNTGYNTLCFKSTLAGDSNLFNNEKCKTVYGQFLTTLPFCDDLDGTSDNWYHADTIWQKGTPAGTSINTAHSAPNAYMTLLNSNYPNSTNSTLVSPQLNFAGLNPNDTATLKVWYTCNSEAVLTGDGTVLEYSVNNGSTWINLSYLNDPLSTNGYNHNVNGSHCWAGNIPWTQFQMKLDPSVFNASSNPVLFRFRFISNSTVNNFDGFAFDDFCIDIPLQQIDAALDSILLPNTAVVLGTSQSVKIRIKNYGVTTLTSIPVHYRINNTGNQYTDVWTGSLLSGASDVITIATPFNVPTSGTTFSITATVNVNGDGYGGNDSIVSVLGILPPAIDAGITEILNPHSDTTDLSVDHIVVVRIKNFGSTALTSIPLQYKVGTIGNPVVETWTGNLAAGSTVDYTFTQTYKPIQTGWYALCAKTNVTNDGLSSNDQKCVNKFGGVGIDDIWTNAFSLDQNRPNPASNNTEIGFTIPVSGKITFTLVDLIGQTIYNETSHHEVGSHLIKLNTTDLQQGVYYYSIVIDGHKLTKKMIVIK